MSLKHEVRGSDASDRNGRLGGRDRLRDALATIGAGSDVALLLVHVDGLRAINVTHGHAVGDGLLLEVAESLAADQDEGDEAFALGGTEFALLLRGVDGIEARARARSLLRRIDRTYTIDGHRIDARTSVGVALADESGASLWRDADASLHDARQRRGVDRLSIFEDIDKDPLVERLALSSELPGAAGRGELVLHFQPIVELSTRGVVGYEALVRWQHPRLGLVAPGSFIPLAESAGLMDGIGAWVLAEACRSAARWPECDGKRPYVSVNVAVDQLRNPGFPARVAAEIARSGLDAERLILEVTETVVAESDVVSPALQAIRRLAVRVFMDDFGTGYSSLGSIRRLPLDGVKIDRSVVRDITTSDHEWSLAVTVVRLLRELGLATTVEGVESAAQLAQLRSLGCSYGQGFYFGRPQPMPDA